MRSNFIVPFFFFWKYVHGFSSGGRFTNSMERINGELIVRQGTN